MMKLVVAVCSYFEDVPKTEATIEMGYLKFYSETKGYVTFHYQTKGYVTFYCETKEIRKISL